MKSGTCPKCKKRNIYKHRSEPKENVFLSRINNEDHWAYRDKNGQTHHIGWTPIDRYACHDCHYTETYLREDSLVERGLDSAESWERISPPAEGPFR